MSQSARRIGLAIAIVIVLAAVLGVRQWWTRSGRAEAPHDWTAEWRSQPPVVTTTPGGLLETATIQMSEDFYRSDTRDWWGIYLGNTVSHIQVVATYRYGVPLTDMAWEVVTRGQTTVVVAPDLRPSLPVAIDTGTWREKTESGWARFDKRTQLDELRRGISDDLDARARDPKRLALAREASRRTIGEFVEQWLLARDAWSEEDVFTAVRVYFLDEVDDTLRRQLRWRPEGD